MIEVGSYLGESTLIFLERAGKVICIDPYLDEFAKAELEHEELGNAMSEVYEAFKQRVLDVHPNVTLLRNTSADASWDIDQMFDLIYIDANHEYEHVKNDIMLYMPFVKPGGWIAGHDLIDYFPGVERAVNEMFGGPDKMFKDTSWAKQRPV